MTLNPAGVTLSLSTMYDSSLGTLYTTSTEFTLTLNVSRDSWHPPQPDQSAQWQTMTNTIRTSDKQVEQNTGLGIESRTNRMSRRGMIAESGMA